MVVLWCFQFRCWQCWQQSGVKRTESLVFASAQLDCLTLPPVGRKTYCKSGFRTHRCSFCIFAFVCYLSVVHDQYTICVHHSVDAMCNGEHGAVMEGFFDCVLYQGVCLWINWCRRLIQKNDLLENKKGPLVLMARLVRKAAKLPKWKVDITHFCKAQIH